MTANEKESVGSGDIEWERKITVLTLLARKVKKVNIATQVGYSDKWVRDVEKEALDYPASLIKTLPPEVQDFIAKEKQNKKHGLKSEIEKTESPPNEAQAILSPNVVITDNFNQVIVSNDNHVEDLSECAKKLVKILETYIGWPINYRVENILNDLKDFENLKFFENKMARGVLVHLAQSEDFPQLKQLDSWIDLKASDINESFLALISLKAANREFKGECDICRAKPDPKRKVA
jgi:hypothetical protein